MTSPEAKVPSWLRQHGLSSSSRKAIETEVIDRFTFLKDYQAVSGNNPLVSGTIDADDADEYVEDVPTSGAEARKPSARELLDLDLINLVQAKTFFLPSVGEASRGGGHCTLNMHDFVRKFSRMCGETTRQQLGYLFMRIDCDSDGYVTWDEFLTYVMARSDSLAKPLADERLQKQLMRQPVMEAPHAALHKEAVAHLLYVPSCAAYVSAAHDGTMRIWSKGLTHELTVEVAEKPVVIHAVCVLPALHKLALATDERQLLLYELLSHANAVRWTLHGKLLLKELAMSLCAWSFEAMDGTQIERLAVGTQDGAVEIFDARTLVRAVKGRGANEPPVKATLRSHKTLLAASIVRLSLHRDWVTQLEYHEGMRALISASHDGLIKMTAFTPPPSKAVAHEESSWVQPAELTVAQCRNVWTCEAHPKGVNRIVQANAGGKKLLASCGRERTASIWNLESQDFMRTLDGHRGTVIDLSFDSTQQILFTLAGDGEVRTWDLSNLSMLSILSQVLSPEDYLAARTSAIHFNPHGQCLVTGARKLGMWFYPSRFAPREVHAARALAPKGHAHPLVAALYSEQFYLIVSGDELGLICVWDVRTGALLFRFEHSCGKLTAMEFDSSGRRLITGSGDGSVRLWNYSSGELLRTISFDAEWADNEHATAQEKMRLSMPRQPASPSPSGSASSPPKTQPSVMFGTRASVQRPERLASEGAAEVEAVKHISQGAVNFYVSVGWSHKVMLWPDADTHHPARRLNGHTDDVLSVAFSPPTLLCTGAYDGTILAWNVVSGVLKFRLTPGPHSSAKRYHRVSMTGGWAFSNAVESLTFLNTSCSLMRVAILVSVSADGCIRFWDAHAGRLIHTVAGACALSESLQHVCAEETNTFLFTGDSGGFVKVWDISDLVEHSSRVQPLSHAAIKLVFSWRAHLCAVVRLEYLKGVEALVSASADCTVRLWTISGEQVGVFGQSEPWQLADTCSWLDAAPASVVRLPASVGASLRMVPSDDKTAVSESKLGKARAPPPVLPIGGAPAHSYDQAPLGRVQLLATIALDTDEVGPAIPREEPKRDEERARIKAAMVEARIQNRDQSTRLAQKSAVVLRPPPWRLDRSKPEPLSLTTDRIAMRRAQSAARIHDGNRLLTHAKAKANAICRLDSTKEGLSPPKYAKAGAWTPPANSHLMNGISQKPHYTPQSSASYERLGLLADPLSPRRVRPEYRAAYRVYGGVSNGYN
ncbi:hypothetical protein AB1Y20_008347 [Prymnesium parvum]